MINAALNSHAKLCAKNFGGNGDPKFLHDASAAMALASAIERLAGLVERGSAHHDDPMVFKYTPPVFTLAAR